MFPSPTGVLYISILNRDTMLLFGGVSVPYWGSLYFNTTNAEIMAFNLDVSVPYWGSLYFNHAFTAYNNAVKSVSVPYWGSLYFNFDSLFNGVTFDKFPSPTGVLYISIKTI